MTHDELERYMNNPPRVITRIYSEIESQFLEGWGELNPKNHPFGYAVDLIVGSVGAYIDRLDNAHSKGYEVFSRNIDDLARKMSDKDWVGIFAEPSSTTVSFNIGLDVLKTESVPFTEVDGRLNNEYKKLVIPRDTVIYIADTPFLLEKAVEVRILEHGGYQVVYDFNKVSSLLNLETNYPVKNVISINNKKYLSIELPVRQLAIKEVPNIPSNVSAGLERTIEFEDRLYAIEAYIRNDNTQVKIPMGIVFNNGNYDPFYPTLEIKLNGDNTFTARIPTVYIKNGTGLGRVTIHVYTTKGEYTRDLNMIPANTNSAGYFNYDNDKGTLLDKYEAPFLNINNVLIATLEPITGGRNDISFEELRNRQIYRYRYRGTPITPSDLSNRLSESGFDSIKSIDMVNDRLYRVTKDYPVQSSKEFERGSGIRLGSAIGSYTSSTLTSIPELIGSGNAFDNGNRITIKPRTVFDITTPTSKIVSSLDVDNLLNSSFQNKIDITSEKTMVATPFYYVIDTTRNRASVRSYHLNDPKIRKQTFKYENNKLGIQLGISKIAITNTGTHFQIDIETASSDTYKELDDSILGVQLGFNINNGGEPTTIRGQLLGKTEQKERVWRFIINTDYDLDEQDRLHLKYLYQFGKLQDDFVCKLTEDINFIFTYGSSKNELLSKSDFKINQELFDTLQIAIIETEYTVEFGTRLKYLHTRIRPMVGDQQYKRYPADVYYHYEENVYKKENGELVFDKETGLPIIEHKKGDIKLDAAGNKIILFRKNEIMYDPETKEPIEKGIRELLYYWDFIGLDFIYWVTQDMYDIEYRESIINFLVSLISKEMKDVNKNKLEKTSIIFKPKSTMGYIDIIINDGITQKIKSSLSFVVEYYVSEEALYNSNMIESIKTNTHNVINKVTERKSFSVSDLISELRTTGGDEVKDVKLNALAGNKMIDIVSVVDNTDGFSVEKIIDLAPDNYLTIKENIDVSFKKHVAKLV